MWMKVAKERYWVLTASEVGAAYADLRQSHFFKMVSLWFLVYLRVSQPWHHKRFGPADSLLWGCPSHSRMLGSIPGLYPQVTW